MIKKISIKKLLISLTALFALFLFYLIPKNEKALKKIPQKLNYVNENVLTSEIFLLNKDDYVSRTRVVVSNKDVSVRAKELLQVLITGQGESKIPNGFKAIIPSDTKIISLKFDNGIIKVNFSKDILDIKEDLEEKLISAIVYTLTSIDEVKGVIIYVEGDILSKLPKTGINLPSTLDKSFGINKEYELSSFDNVNSVTVYYVDEYNDNFYYIPVTKYLNDSREKISIIIDTLTSYNKDLMSFLNSNTELLSSSIDNRTFNLEFNSHIFDDLNSEDILEEVIYTIGLSVNDNYDVDNIVYKVNDKEICKTVLKGLE